MKFPKTLLLTSLLLANSAYAADAAGFNVGSFNMEFNPVGHEYQINNGGKWENHYIPNSRAFLENPICYAIANLKRLEIVIDLNEYISPKELKITIKKLTVEPYAFGLAKDGSLALQGKITAEKMLKEISIKYGEDKFHELIVPSAQKNKSNGVQNETEDDSEDYSPLYDTGYYKGKFISDKDTDIDIRRIRWVQVIENSHFEVPKDFKQVIDDSMQVICQLPEVKKSDETVPAKL